MKQARRTRYFTGPLFIGSTEAVERKKAREKEMAAEAVVKLLEANKMKLERKRRAFFL